MKEQIPRRTACFPISVVQELTSLSARQIRYYEEQGLIQPKRNDGNQRIFSLEDIDQCAKIKELIDQGLNIAGVKTVLASKPRQGNENAGAALKQKDMQRLRMYLNESDL